MFRSSAALLDDWMSRNSFRSHQIISSRQAAVVLETQNDHLAWRINASKGRNEPCEGRISASELLVL